MEKSIKISLLFDFYGQLLSEKQKQAVALYYNDDLSLAEIADIMNITRQGVRDFIKRGEAQLFGFEKSLGLYERFENIERLVQSIKQEAQKIKSTDDKEKILTLADEIILSADKINEINE